MIPLSTGSLVTQQEACHVPCGGLRPNTGLPRVGVKCPNTGLPGPTWRTNTEDIYAATEPE